MIADDVGIIDHIEHIDCISIKAFLAGIPQFTFAVVSWKGMGKP